MKTKQEQITENNILMLAFMEEEKYGDVEYKINGVIYNISNVPYSKDWNFLIPVMKKCYQSAIELGSIAWAKRILDMMRHFDTVVMAGELLSFIEWYNREQN